LCQTPSARNAKAKHMRWGHAHRGSARGCASHPPHPALASRESLGARGLMHHTPSARSVASLTPRHWSARAKRALHGPSSRSTIRCCNSVTSSCDGGCSASICRGDKRARIFIVVGMSAAFAAGISAAREKALAPMSEVERAHCHSRQHRLVASASHTVTLPLSRDEDLPPPTSSSSDSIGGHSAAAGGSLGGSSGERSLQQTPALTSGR